MKYKVSEKDGLAVILDESGKSIVDITTDQDPFNGRFYHTPAFAPDIARKIVAALDLAAAVDALKAAGHPSPQAPAAIPWATPDQQR